MSCSTCCTEARGLCGLKENIRIYHYHKGRYGYWAHAGLKKQGLRIHKQCNEAELSPGL